MTPTAIKVLTILTGLLIAGEALALFVGMHVLSSGGNPWISLKNDMFLGLDIVAGSGLVIVAAVNGRAYVSGVLYVLVLVSVVAHVYRGWEYLVRVVNAFCANAPLFAVNNLKPIGLLVIAGLIVLRITSRG